MLRDTPINVQEGERGKAIGRRGSEKVIDEIMRPPSSLTLLFSVNGIAKRMEFSVSEPYWTWESGHALIPQGRTWHYA